MAARPSTGALVACVTEWLVACAPRLVPPMHVCALIFAKSPTARMVFVVCAASSRVGDRMSACTLSAERPHVQQTFSKSTQQSAEKMGASKVAGGCLQADNLARL